MVRSSKVIVEFDNGTIAEAVVKTHTSSSQSLTRDEVTRQHDSAVDKVAEALRVLPYAGTAPLRAVSIGS